MKLQKRQKQPEKPLIHQTAFRLVWCPKITVFHHHLGEDSLLFPSILSKFKLNLRRVGVNDPELGWDPFGFLHGFEV